MPRTITDQQLTRLIDAAKAMGDTGTVLRDTVAAQNKAWAEHADARGVLDQKTAVATQADSEVANAVHASQSAEDELDAAVKDIASTVGP